MNSKLEFFGLLVSILVAGSEAKLDLLIDAWNIDVPEAPSVAAV